MRGSLRLGRIFGIDLYVHFTFFLLLAWIVVGQYLATKSLALAAGELLFVLLVFATVVLHECGHALAARWFGVGTRDITLLPIGGVARLERIPENPVQELVIALAGPAVNVLLAAACFAWLFGSYQLGSALGADLFSGGLVQRLLWVNVALAIFNMLPAFPMDGGRVLRALLALGMNYVRATQIAARVGQAFALLIGLLGLASGNLLLLVVAFFVWIGAAQEALATETRSNLAGAIVRSAMISNFTSASPDEPLDAVAQRVLDGYQHDFPVVERDELVGMLTRDKLLEALARPGQQQRVAEVMDREFVSVEPQQSLADAFGKLQASECDAIPVVENGHLVGVISAENVGEYMQIQAAARQATLAA